MSHQIFSRLYLQGIPEQRKQENINNLINTFVHEICTVAAAGKTSYIYELNNNKCIARQYPPPPVITNDDLISAFNRRFPDCDISYQEIWVDVNSNNRVLKKGIVIDWS